jgi:hypothetical protein
MAISHQALLTLDQVYTLGILAGGYSTASASWDDKTPVL